MSPNGSKISDEDIRYYTQPSVGKEIHLEPLELNQAMSGINRVQFGDGGRIALEYFRKSLDAQLLGNTRYQAVEYPDGRISVIATESEQRRSQIPFIFGLSSMFCNCTVAEAGALKEVILHSLGYYQGRTDRPTTKLMLWMAKRLSGVDFKIGNIVAFEESQLFEDYFAPALDPYIGPNILELGLSEFNRVSEELMTRLSGYKAETGIAEAIERLAYPVGFIVENRPKLTISAHLHQIVDAFIGKKLTYGNNTKELVNTLRKLFSL